MSWDENADVPGWISATLGLLLYSVDYALRLSRSGWKSDRNPGVPM